MYVKVCFQEHLGIDYEDLIHVTFQDFLEPFMDDEVPPFCIVPQKQVFTTALINLFYKYHAYVLYCIVIYNYVLLN